MSANSWVTVAAAFLISLAFLSLAGSAAASIGSPGISNGKIYEGQLSTISIPVSSSNDVTQVLIEILNMTLPENSTASNSTVASTNISSNTTSATNSSAENYTATLVGTPRVGNWVYYFGGYAGLYQITRAFVTDNTSSTQVADFTSTFYGLEIVAAPMNSTNVTATTTSTTTPAPSTATETSTTTTTLSYYILSNTPVDTLYYLVNNPIFLIIILSVIIVPLVIFFVVIKRRPKEYLPKKENPSDSRRAGEEGSGGQQQS